ncbi:MAG TPA: Hsp20/alpha crystallin family protein [Chthonomonadaceae bacterium]|nr:Hsp20/alpha crystallin family protein [Chthonomonadaceae bacterium]
MSEHNNQATIARRTPPAPARWSPFEELTEMRRQMDDVFGRMFGYTPLAQLIPTETVVFEPFVDIYETNDKILLFASLPGYAPENINVEATGETITIFGERKPLFENEKAIPHKQVGLVNAGSFRASYTLPIEVDPNKIKATFYHGVLQLELPKTEKARTKTVKVNVIPVK